MKLRNLLLFAAALSLPKALPVANFTLTSTNSGAWNPTTIEKWNGVEPVQDNTANVIFEGNTPITTYGTRLCIGDRTFRSLTFSMIGTLLVNGRIQSNILFGQNLNDTHKGITAGTLGGSGLINANVTSQGASKLSLGEARNAGVNSYNITTFSIGGNLDNSLCTTGSGVIGSFYTLLASNNQIPDSLEPANLYVSISDFDDQPRFSDSRPDLILTVSLPNPTQPYSAA